MATVSVIIPTHARPDLLPRAVDSARQAGTDVEIIVVDDASTDETARVCQGLENIKYVRVERNQGVAGARNLGIFVSTSDYIAFLDDDDLRLPGSLDHQLAALKANPEAGFVCGANDHGRSGLSADRRSYSPASRRRRRILGTAGTGLSDNAVMRVDS